MGTIRNKMLIIYHYDKNVIHMMRKDAVRHFQETVREDSPHTHYNVDRNMVSPVLSLQSDGMYVFAIMGDCSKNGWDTSELFEMRRQEYVEKWIEADNPGWIILMDFGEDYECSIEDYGAGEFDREIRNKLLIVHHYSENTIKDMRQDALQHFKSADNNKIADTSNYFTQNVISPVMSSLINGEYSFVVVGSSAEIGNDGTTVFGTLCNNYISKWTLDDLAYKMITVSPTNDCTFVVDEYED